MDYMEEIKQIQRCKGSDGTVGLTCGCFDLLHLGHINMLREAAQACHPGVLVVGLNTDDWVRRLKGSGRPVNTFEVRKEILLTLSYVDHVLPIEENSVDLLKRLKPDIFVKGGDYAYTTDINPDELQAAKKYAGMLYLTSHSKGFSTTNVVSALNLDLLETLRKATQWDSCTISASEDFNLDKPYIIDFEDEAVFYTRKADRDEALWVLRRLVPLLRGSFSFKEGEDE